MFSPPITRPSLELSTAKCFISVTCLWTKGSVGTSDLSVWTCHQTMHQSLLHWKAETILLQFRNKVNLAFQEEIPADLLFPEFLRHLPLCLYCPSVTLSYAFSASFLLGESPGGQSISPLSLPAPHSDDKLSESCRKLFN